MKPRSKPATKSERRRYQKLKDLGCIINRLKLWSPHPERCCGAFPVEIQHYTSGGRRISNLHTIPLCNFHHRAQLPEGMTTTQATDRYGPSFAKSRRKFELTFGSEEYLLEETNKLLGDM